MDLRSTKPLLGLTTAAVLCLAAALPLRAFAAQVPVSPPAAPSTQPGPQQSDRINVVIRVQVLGAVLRPGNITVNEGDRLLTALARAGADASAKSDMSRVVLIRIDQGGKRTSFMIDVHKALEKGDQRYDPILREGDTIYIPEARSAILRPFQIANIRA